MLDQGRAIAKFEDTAKYLVTLALFLPGTKAGKTMSGYKFKTQQLIFIALTLIFVGGPILFLVVRYQRNSPSGKTNLNNEKGFADNFEFNPTHVVNIQYSGGQITVRKRPMIFSEYQLANSGTLEGDQLNRATVVGYLSNGTVVELIGQEGISFKIRYKGNSKIVEGYIAISVQNTPSLYPLGKSGN